MERRKRIYIAIPEDLLEAIDRMRTTPKGTISRSDFITSVLRTALQNNAKEVRVVG